MKEWVDKLPEEQRELRNVNALSLDAFLEKQIPARETILSPWLPQCGLAMIHGPRGIAKTQLAVGTGWASASGGGFLKWHCEKAWRVLFLDGEMPGADLQARFRAVMDASRFTLADPDYLKIAASDLTNFGLPDLSDPKAQGFYDDVIADADLIIVDNLSTLCRGLKENDAEFLGAGAAMGTRPAPCRPISPIHSPRRQVRSAARHVPQGGCARHCD